MNVEAYSSITATIRYADQVESVEAFGKGSMTRKEDGVLRFPVDRALLTFTTNSRRFTNNVLSKVRH
ncbi:hypothetical protein AVEN_96535-1, partial [Araneus ventricosus]